ncbi:MAG: hypothetical protein ACTSP1_19965, partial [Candidatus Freyarchaeota archaeon]
VWWFCMLLGDAPRLFVFEGEWDDAVSAFSLTLRRELGDSLIGVIATPREEVHVYGANVLVVLAEDKPELRVKVLNTAKTAEGKAKGVTITPFITTREDRRIIHAFLHSYDANNGKWEEAVPLFRRLLEDELGGRVLQVVASPSEKLSLYGANVLVVLVEKKVGGVTITPFITTREDGRIIHAFSQKSERRPSLRRSVKGS